MIKDKCQKNLQDTDHTKINAKELKKITGGSTTDNAAAELKRMSPGEGSIFLVEF